jgi:hypothetical protein
MLIFPQGLLSSSLVIVGLINRFGIYLICSFPVQRYNPCLGLTLILNLAWDQALTLCATCQPFSLGQESRFLHQSIC